MSLVSILRKMRSFIREKNPSYAWIFSNGLKTLNITSASSIKAHNEWDNLLGKIVIELNVAPMTFLRQPTISRTVHPNQQKLAHDYFSEMKESSFFATNILPKITESPMGDPFLCHFFPYASPLTIQHIYYVYLLWKGFGIFLPDSPIVNITELGAGYGNLFRLLRNMGYQRTYTIIDLPDMQTMQQHYLTHIFSKKMIETAVSFHSTENLPLKSEDPSILFATFSVSEMPLVLRQKIEPFYAQFDYLFFAYNLSFDGVDNQKYFETLAVQLSKNFDVRHFKDQFRRAWFMMCRRKGLTEQ